MTTFLQAKKDSMVAEKTGLSDERNSQFASRLTHDMIDHRSYHTQLKQL